MAPPEFKDFNKVVSDLLDDDFDTKYSLKVKSKAPQGVAITVTTDYAKSALSGKLSAKWAHESGFAIEKLELNKSGNLTVETSLKGAIPNVKFDFKGNDSNKGDLLATYSNDVATIVGELDVAEFSGFNVSALAKQGPYSGGASVSVSLGDKVDVKNFDVAGSFKDNGVFAGLKISEKFANYTASVNYSKVPKVNFGGKFDFKPESSAFSSLLVASYSCNPDTQIKVKASNEGALNFSVKQSLSPNFTVTSSLATSTKNFGDYQLGLVGNLA